MAWLLRILKTLRISSQALRQWVKMELFNDIKFGTTSPALQQLNLETYLGDGEDGIERNIRNAHVEIKRKEAEYC
jgi:hypothetical protein